MRLDFTGVMFILVTSHLAVALLAAPGWYVFLSIVAWFGSMIMAVSDPTPRPRRRRRLTSRNGRW